VDLIGLVEAHLLEMGWDVKIMADLEEINKKLDFLIEYNANLGTMTLLRVKNGQLLADIDKKNKQIERMQASLTAINDLATFGRLEQNHLPRISELAKKGLNDD